jgi:hypothetical protein
MREASSRNKFTMALERARPIAVDIVLDRTARVREYRYRLF